MRREDWQERLHEYVESMRDVPFDWAANDCARFTAGAVEAVTGTKFWDAPYTTAAEAARYMENHDPREVLDALFDRVPAAQARRGDVVLVRNDDRDVLGVCTGQWSASPGPDGIVLHPTLGATLAWRVD